MRSSRLASDDVRLGKKPARAIEPGLVVMPYYGKQTKQLLSRERKRRGKR